MSRVKAGFKRNDILFAAAIVLGLIFTLFFVYVRYYHLLNSDNASTLMISKILSEEGGIYSKNWCYSTGVGVLDSTTVVRFVFMILGNNYKLVRIVSIGINLILVIMSYLFMMKQAGHFRAGLITAVVFYLPYNNEIAMYPVFFMAYINVYVFMFLTLGSLFMLIKLTGEKGDSAGFLKERKTHFSFILLLLLLILLNVLSALNGIRQLMYFGVPLCLTALIILIMDIVGAGRAGEKFEPAKSRGILILILSAISTAASFAGLVINVLAFVNGENYSESIYNWIRFSFHNTQNVLIDLLSFFGWNRYTNVFSLWGIKNLISVVLLIIVIALNIIELKKIIHRDYSEKTLYIFSIVSLLMFMFLYSMTSSYEIRYWVASVPLLFILPGIYIEENLDINGKSIYFLMLLVMVLSSVQFMQDDSLNTNKTDLKALVKWLEDKPYKAGFAKFWQSDILTELTDGRMEMYTIFQDGDMAHVEELSTRRPWLQKISHLKEDPEGEVIFILSRDEYDLEDESQCTLLSMDDHLVFEGDWIKVYGFKDMEEYYRAVAEAENQILQ